jgi:hypothetical protein
LADTICPEDLVKLIQPTRAAALLLMAALAACSDAPTGAAFTAPDQPAAAFNTAPTVTVTNSGGYPLISWGAVSGATSYTVSLITFYTINGTYQSHGLNPITTTTSTSYLDVDNVYTGVYGCNYEPDWGGDTGGVWYEYTVQANFPQGSSNYLYSRHYANIAHC